VLWWGQCIFNASPTADTPQLGLRQRNRQYTPSHLCRCACPCVAPFLQIDLLCTKHFHGLKSDEVLNFSVAITVMRVQRKWRARMRAAQLKRKKDARIARAVAPPDWREVVAARGRLMKASWQARQVGGVGWGCVPCMTHLLQQRPSLCCQYCIGLMTQGCSVLGSLLQGGSSSHVPSKPGCMPNMHQCVGDSCTCQACPWMRRLQPYKPTVDS
jgi:hypothetical protein